MKQRPFVVSEFLKSGLIVQIHAADTSGDLRAAWCVVHLSQVAWPSYGPGLSVRWLNFKSAWITVETLSWTACDLPFVWSDSSEQFDTTRFAVVNLNPSRLVNLFVILLVSGLISLPARPCGVFRPILRLHVVRRILNKGPDTRRIALRMGSKISAVYTVHPN